LLQEPIIKVKSVKSYKRGKSKREILKAERLFASLVTFGMLLEWKKGKGIQFP